jgi:hypothetical protein
MLCSILPNDLTLKQTNFRIYWIQGDLEGRYPKAKNTGRRKRNYDKLLRVPGNVSWLDAVESSRIRKSPAKNVGGYPP